ASGENCRFRYCAGSGGIVCVSPPVAMLRSHMLSIPLFTCTFSRYLPSGEIAASLALPVLVNCSIVKFWNGGGPLRFRNQYKPPATITMIAAAATIGVQPSRREALGTETEALPELGVSAATAPLPLLSGGTRFALAGDELSPVSPMRRAEPLSRCRRLRSL